MTEGNSSKPSAPRKGLTKTQIILITGMVSILVAVCVVGYFIYKALQKPPVIEYAEARTGNYVVDEGNLDEIKGQMQQKVDEGMFEVTMNTTWRFPSGSEASENAYVANAKSNRKPIFFEISLKDSGDVIYTSSVIPVGSALRRLILDQPLEKGTYSAICKYNLLDEDNQIASSLSVNVAINVLK